MGILDTVLNRIKNSENRLNPFEASPSPPPRPQYVPPNYNPDAGPILSFNHSPVKIDALPPERLPRVNAALRPIDRGLLKKIPNVRGGFFRDGVPYINAQNLGDNIYTDAPNTYQALPIFLDPRRQPMQTLPLVDSTGRPIRGYQP